MSGEVKSEELDTQRAALDYVCRECSATDNPLNWLGGEKIAATGLCFTCHHWDELLARKDDPTVVRAQHRHYIVGAAKTPHRFNGFGGSEFKIRFNDGREVVTVDLWSQGTIPAHYRERMPDNAVFLEGMGRHDD
jgi:hypothetical protein